MKKQRSAEDAETKTKEQEKDVMNMIWKWWQLHKRFRADWRRFKLMRQAHKLEKNRDYASYRPATGRK